MVDNDMRPTVKKILKKYGLLSFSQSLRNGIHVITRPKLYSHEFKRLQNDRVIHRRFLQFRQQYGTAYKVKFDPAQDNKTVLIVGVGFPEVEIELALIKSFELAGFTPFVLIVHALQNKEYYKLSGIREVHHLNEYIDPMQYEKARKIVEGFSSIQDLLDFEFLGTRVGKYAAQTVLRNLRVGYLDLKSPEVAFALTGYLAFGMAVALASQQIMKEAAPAMALFHDCVYLPEGVLFDACLKEKVVSVRWHPAHKSNALMLKRYTPENINDHPVSLSPLSWEIVRNMPWTEAHRERINQEFIDSYSSGDWYSEAGTQFNKNFVEPAEIRKHIGLDPDKKTAFIFPHISWDAPFSWGTSLFDSYEEWFIETVRAACTNESVNWVIKIHPANVGKSLQDGLFQEPAEVTALKKYIGNLPGHIFIIPAEDHLSTLSLFSIMDFCLTLRGTVGIEAARFGIPVLTAGTGRYDQKNFTIDSQSRQQYLDRVARIQDIPRLSSTQQELAERFAYGLYLLRPLVFDTITFRYPEQDAKNRLSVKLETQLNIKTRQDWENAADLKDFCQWAVHSVNPDFLVRNPEHD
jgi:hypothetical protein